MLGDLQNIEAEIGRILIAFEKYMSVVRNYTKPAAISREEATHKIAQLCSSRELAALERLKHGKRWVQQAGEMPIEVVNYYLITDEIAQLKALKKKEK